MLTRGRRTDAQSDKGYNYTIASIPATWHIGVLPWTVHLQRYNFISFIDEQQRLHTATHADTDNILQFSKYTKSYEHQNEQQMLIRI